jgi:hypothetical protein
MFPGKSSELCHFTDAVAPWSMECIMVKYFSVMRLSYCPKTLYCNEKVHFLTATLLSRATPLSGNTELMELTFCRTNFQKCFCPSISCSDYYNWTGRPFALMFSNGYKFHFVVFRCICTIHDRKTFFRWLMPSTSFTFQKDLCRKAFPT